MIFGIKNVGPKNILFWKKFGYKKIKVQTVWLKLGLRYCCHRQMSSGQMLPGQMSPWHMASVKDGSRNLHLKFGQNWFSYSWDIADIIRANVAWINVTLTYWIC